MTWLDNKVVTSATNYCTCNPVSAAQQWSKSAKKRVDAPMPKGFEGYNKQMGGADLFDQFVSTFRVRIRSKKWWWSFLAWVVNALIANAWNLFRTVQKQKIGLLKFKREVTLTILASFGRHKPAKSLAFPRNIASNVKLDTKNHILVKGSSKYCRCKYCGGRSIYLHPYCLKDYHFLAWAVNALIANAWNLFRTVQKQKIGLLKFKREVTLTILASFGRHKPAKSLAFPRNIASNVKLDTKNHILVKGSSKYCRCKYCGGRSIYLHPYCLKDYHS